MEEIPPKELNAYISEFIITVRKKEDNEDYQPSSLRSLMASFERCLKKKNSTFLSKALINGHIDLFNNEVQKTKSSRFGFRVEKAFETYVS